MRILLLSLSLAILLSSSSAALIDPLSRLSSLLQLSSNWPELISGLNKAQTGGEAVKGVLQFLQKYYNPKLDVEGIYQGLQNSQYAGQLNAGFKYSNDFSKLTQGLIQLLQNSSNNPSVYVDIVGLVLNSGVLDYNAFTQPPPPPPNATQSLFAGPFLQNAFKNFTHDFFANLLGSMTPEELQMIVADTIKQSLTPEIISGLKQILALVNPQLAQQLQNVSDPNTIYAVLQNLLQPFVMNTYLNEVLSYFGIDLAQFFGSPSTLTTSAPSVEYLLSLKSMLDILDNTKYILQMGTQQTKALYLASVWRQYPTVSQTLLTRLQATRPAAYNQIAQFLNANDSANAVIAFIPYLPELLGNDLQTLKQQYNVDYTDLFQNYILPLNPSTIAPLTNPPPTTAGTNPPLTQQTTRPPTTPPPPATTQSTPPPTTPSTTRPPTTPPPPPPATTQSTPPPTTPSTTRPSTTPPPPPATTQSTPPPTTPSTTRPPTTPSPPPQTTASTTFDFWAWLNNLATTTTSSTTQRTTLPGGTTPTTRKPNWG